MWTAKDLSHAIKKSKGERLKAEIKTLDRLLEHANCEALNFAQELEVLEKVPCLIVGTSWDCPKSPFGLCVYDNYKDGAHDNCLFCHDPEERK